MEDLNLLEITPNLVVSASTKVLTTLKIQSQIVQILVRFLSRRQIPQVPTIIDWKNNHQERVMDFYKRPILVLISIISIFLERYMVVSTHLFHLPLPRKIILCHLRALTKAIQVPVATETAIILEPLII